jgi:hypothetical protein
LYFFGYEATKRYVQPTRAAADKSPATHFAAGLVAEFLGALIWTPMVRFNVMYDYIENFWTLHVGDTQDVIKQRQQMQKGGAGSVAAGGDALPYRTVSAAVKTILKHDVCTLFFSLSLSLSTSLLLFRFSWLVVQGALGLYKGFGAGLAVYGPFVGIYFVVYEQWKKSIGSLFNLTGLCFFQKQHQMRLT